jgi:heptosyltransferase-2
VPPRSRIPGPNWRSARPAPGCRNSPHGPHPPHEPTSQNVSSSALIIRLAAIGDVVVSLPMVSAIRARNPDARISWMCGHTVAPLVRAVEGISEVLEVDETAIFSGTPTAKVAAVLGAWRKTFGRYFDAVYVAHPDRRYGMLAWAVRARTTRSLGGDAGHRRIVPGRTRADEYVRLITGSDDWQAQSFSAPSLRVSMPPALAQRIDQFNPDGLPLVALTPGGARNVARENPLRRWPLERYAALAQALDDIGYRIVITGDGGDEWTRHAFQHHRVLDLVGATDICSLASVLQRCAAVVAHDSGALHLARLVGAPVVALLGPTPPSMFRADSRTLALWPGESLPCAPCYDGKEFATCGNNICMQMIEVECIVRHLTSTIGASSAAARLPFQDF